MKLKLKSVWPLGIAAGLLALAFVFGGVTPSNVSAETKPTSTTNQKAKSSDKTPAKNDTKDQKKTTNSVDATYEYVAQPGDSYTKMARKAVQTFGIVKHVNLSGAQIIYAETNLTQAANSPVLELGQKVSIKVSDIQNWVNSAEKLNKQQLAAWNYYVQFVNFDTDAVGQSKQ